MEKRPALGKGLSALIPDAPEPPRASPVELDIDRLTPNTFQPRSTFNEARLEELAQSIKSNGIIPLGPWIDHGRPHDRARFAAAAA